MFWRKIKQDEGDREWGGGVDRRGLSSKQKPEESARASRPAPEGRCSRQRGGQMQKLRGGSAQGRVKNSQEARPVCLGHVRKDPQEVKSELGGGPDPTGPPGHCKGFILTLSEVAAIEGF